MRNFIKILFILNSTIYGDNYGALLFNGNCTTCHFIDKDVSAPAMKKVQARYKSVFAKKEEFVQYMSKWVASPSEERSIMLDAVKKYELMPMLGFEEEVLKEIVSYIYETDFKEERLR